MASRSLNRVMLIGHLGRDCESKFTPNGTGVVKFSVATSRRWKDKQSGEWREETDWCNITFWRGENVAPYLLKGTQVYVEGRLQTRSYEDKDGKKVYATDVVADEVILLGGRGQGESGEREPVSAPRSSRPQAPRQSEPVDDLGQGITDDEVPF